MGVGGFSDTPAHAGADETQLNISSSDCVVGGAHFHFVAPHEDDGTGGTLSGTYTLNGGATMSFSGVAESTANNSSNAQWDVTLTGSGTFVIKTATSTGGDVYTGNGDDVGTITCGATTGSLTVIKMVDNTANPDATGVPADFSIHVKDSSNAEVSGSPQPGSTTGTGYTLAAGTYTVSETGGPSGYTSAFSGDCDSSGAVTVAAGHAATCTITNTANAATTGSLTVIKMVDNTANPDAIGVPADFSIHVMDSSNADVSGSPQPGSTTGTSYTLDAGTYSVSETGGPTGYTASYSGDCDSSGAVTVAAGHDATCTITNTAAPAETVTATVTVVKYVDGSLATTGSFDLSSTTTAANVSGCESGCTNPFTLDSGNGYTATTVAMNLGSQYSVVENGVNGQCGPNDTYRLVGYGIGDTLEAAASATPVASASFSDITGNAFVVVQNATCQAETGQFTVTIGKFISGDHATADNTGGASFHMESSWNAANLGGAGSGTYDLSATNGYEATTSSMDAGSSYTTDEIHIPMSAADCSSTDAFYLAGYGTSSTSLADAASGTLSQTAPSFDDLQGNEFVAVVNAPCQAETAQFTVTIGKYISQDHATADNTGGASFNMESSWNAANLGGSGSGTYDLGPTGFNNPNAYEATTAMMDAGSSYSTDELHIPTSAGDCTSADAFYLVGYGTSSTSLADAASSTLSQTTPSFDDLQSNEFVAVVNAPCQPQTLSGSITIVKQWDGDTSGNPTASFTTSANVGVSGNEFNLPNNGSNSMTFDSLDAGTYVFTEGQIDGWNLTSVGCVENGVSSLAPTVIGTNHELDVVLAQGQNLTCTFVNTQQASTPTATVTVVKYIDGSLATTGTFDLSSTTTAANVPGCESGCTNPFTLDSGNGFSATTVAMNLGSQYSLVENGVPSGACGPNDTYRLAGYGIGATLADAAAATPAATASFSDITGDAFVVVQNVTCPTPSTGSVTINKVWIGAAGTASLSQTFNSDNGGAFSLSGTNGNTMSFTDVAPNLSGTAYTVTEQSMTGWQLTGLACSGNVLSHVGVDLSGAALSLNVAAGEHLVCTFTNTANTAVSPEGPADRTHHHPGDERPAAREFVHSYYRSVYSDDGSFHAHEHRDGNVPGQRLDAHCLDQRDLGRSRTHTASALHR